MRWERAARAGAAVRAATEADASFLERLYIVDREAEFASLPWPPERRAALLRTQAQMRARQHHAQHPRADSWIVELDGEAIGRLLLDRAPGAWSVVDVVLAPARRGQGLGAALLGDVLDAAAFAGVAVTLHVERTNPARRLYARLGFEVEEAGEVYDRLRWTPAAQANTAS